MPSTARYVFKGTPVIFETDIGFVQEGAIVVDVGINFVPDKAKASGFRLVGDVDFEAVSRKAAFITPVPGGVGPVTSSLVLSATTDAFVKFRGQKRKSLDIPMRSSASKNSLI